MAIRVGFLYKLLISSFSLSIFSEGILLPIYAIFVQKVGGDILDAGYAMGIFLITQGLFTMLVHRKNWNKSQRRLLLIFGWLIWVTGIGMYIFISNVLMLFVAQIITAIGNAMADPIFDGELAAHVDKNVEELEWGMFEGSKGLVEGVAAIVGALVANYFGFDVLIYLMIGTATVSFACILVYAKMTDRNSRRGATSV